MQIVVRQKSGLGNQLFQYAAGRFYAHQTAASLRIATDPAEHAFSYGSPRPFLLSHFALRAPVAELTPRERFLLSDRRSLRPVTATLRKSMGVQIIQETLAQRHHFLHTLEFAPRTRTAYLVGYWQTHQIAQSVEAALRDELKFREAPVGKTAEVLGQIELASCPVSLHVRRGDYTLAAEGNRVLPMDFYARAIRRVQEQISRPRFFVFSDDIAFARANLPEAIDAVFVEHNDAATAHEDLRLMAACRHHIIANSSFSWWGAWLNGRADKRVIAPKQWLMTASSYFPDLTPPAWDLLDVT